MGFSHTPYISLYMTHTTKITLSRRHNICCSLLFVSIPVIKLTLFICLPIRQPPPPFFLSLTHTTPASTPLPDYRLSLTHTKLSLSHPRLVFLSQTLIGYPPHRFIHPHTLASTISYMSLSRSLYLCRFFVPSWDTPSRSCTHTLSPHFMVIPLAHTHSLCLCHTRTPSSSSLPLSDTHHTHTHMGFLQQLARCPCVARNIKMHLYE